MYFHKHFNLTSHEPASSPLAFVAGGLRKFVSHSTLVARSILEDKPVDAGSTVTPSYDTDETIQSGVVNLFTNPNLSSLDRFEALRSLGQDAISAYMDSSVDSSSSSSSVDSDSSTPSTDVNPSE